nr:alpha,alpha-trehalase [Chloroflexaceae bacterium]
GGAERFCPEMYGWDTFFINCGLLAHNRSDLVRNHIGNQLHQIERFGMVLNGNRSYYRTRSQPPLLPESIRRYVEATGDKTLLLQAYPLLEREYTAYWNAPHHQTPIGLATNRDIGDTDAPRLHAESEALDFFAGFDGEVRHCVPLITNCLLVNYARVLAWMATQLGRTAEAADWNRRADERTELIQRYCWNDEAGFLFEYNFVTQRQVPVWSLCAYWAMWAGATTPAQNARLVQHLARFAQPHGLALTDRDYGSPHPEFTWVQWSYPAGWPPFHLMVVEALDRAGYPAEAAGVARRYLGLMLRIFEQTGKLWEKYNVVDGSLDFPHERYQVPPLHGWSSAAAVLLGRRVFETRNVERGTQNEER